MTQLTQQMYISGYNFEVDQLQFPGLQLTSCVILPYYIS